MASATAAQAEVEKHIVGSSTEYKIEEDSATLLSAAALTVEIDRVEQTGGEVKLWLSAWQKKGAKRSVYFHYPEKEGRHTYDLGRFGQSSAKIDVTADRLTSLTVTAPNAAH